MYGITIDIIGHSKHHDKAVKFRVDRIAACKLTELPAIPAPKDFDLSSFMQSVFQMYDGPLINITLKCKNEMMKVIIDRFGEEVKIEMADARHFYAKVKVAVSKTFFGWIFGMDGAIKIAAPEKVVKAYNDMLNRANL